MSSCDNFQELACKILDGELSESEKAELSEHLSTCENCKKLYEVFCLSRDLLGKELVEPPPSLSIGVMNAVREMSATSAVGEKTHRWTRQLALAACAALVVFAAWKSLPLAGSEVLNSIDKANYAIQAAPSPVLPDPSPPSAEATKTANGRQHADVKYALDVPGDGEDPDETMGFMSDVVEPLASPNGLSLCDNAGHEMLNTSVSQIIIRRVSTPENLLEASVTCTDEACISFIMGQLLICEPAENVEPMGEPSLVFELTGVESGPYCISVWIIDGRLYCLSELDNTRYLATGSPEELSGFIDELF